MIVPTIVNAMRTLRVDIRKAHRAPRPRAVASIRGAARTMATALSAPSQPAPITAAPNAHSTRPVTAPAAVASVEQQRGDDSQLHVSFEDSNNRPQQSERTNHRRHHQRRMGCVRESVVERCQGPVQRGHVRWTGEVQVARVRSLEQLLLRFQLTVGLVEAFPVARSHD